MILMRTLPTLGPGAARVPLAQWLDYAFKRPGQAIDDIHFDQLAGPWEDVHDGVQWVGHCCDALEEVIQTVRRRDNLVGVRHVIAALPLDDSKHVRLWKPRYWLKAGMGYEPPSLILVKSDKFYDHYDEEYFRRLNLPITGYPNVNAVFRSQRNYDGPGASDDFGNVIFLVAPLNG